MAVVGILGQTGGGVALPATIAAGDTVIHSIFGDKTGAPPTDGVYVNVGTNYGFTVIKAGTYRFKYDNKRLNTALTANVRLTKNGSEVATSVLANSNHMTATHKTIDVSLAAGDAIRLQWEYYDATAYLTNTYFIVSILAADMQTELNKAGTPL